MLGGFYDYVFRMTLHGFYKFATWSCWELGQSVSPKYHQLRMSWDSIICLLPSNKYFSCPLCTTSPNIIICDGLTLGFKKLHRIPVERTEMEGELLDGCG